MNHVSLSLLAIGIAAVFSNPASAAESSINGWGKAYAEAASKQAQASTNAQAMLTIQTASPDMSGGKAAAEKAGAAVQSGVEKGKATFTTASEKAQTALGNAVAKASENRSNFEGVSIAAKTDASSSLSLPRNAMASAKAASEVMALVGGKPAAAKPETPKSDAPKMDTPVADASKPADSNKVTDANKTADAGKAGESGKATDGSKPAAASNNGAVANANVQASVGVSIGAGERKANVERSAVSLFERPQALLERPQALLERPAGLIDRPLAVLDRPVLVRPERVGGLFR